MPIALMTNRILRHFRVWYGYHHYEITMSVFGGILAGGLLFAGMWIGLAFAAVYEPLVSGWFR